MVRALTPWFVATRPKTLPAAAAPVVTAASLAALHPDYRLWPAFLCLGCALLIQIATNFYNDAKDGESGLDDSSRLGPTRTAATGTLSSRQLKHATALCFAAAFALGLPLAYEGGWPILALGLSSIGAGYWYSLGRRSLSATGLADIAAIGFFGLGAVVGTYYVMTSETTSEVWLTGTALGLLILAILIVNNLRDRGSDARHGRRTLVIRWGPSFGRIQYALCLLVPYVLAFWVMPKNGLIVVACGLPLSLHRISLLWRHDGAALNPVLAKTAQHALVMAVLWSVGVHL